MRKCRVCRNKYKVNRSIPGCCSEKCYKIRRKKLSVEGVYYLDKMNRIKKYMDEQMLKALVK